MKRGERQLHRELAAAATAVAESSNYAEEYMAKARLLRAENALFACVVLNPPVRAAKVKACS